MKTTALRVILAIVVSMGILVAFLYRDSLDAVVLENWVRNAGAAGPLLFIGIYATGTLLFLPGSVLTIAGGALFGPVWGTFYNLIGASIGATLAYLVARYMAADWVEQKTGGRLKKLKDGVEGEGWHFVAFARLVPIFPFNLLNYALGLTRISLAHYTITTFIAMIPGAFAYTYLGYVGREAVAGGAGLIQKGLLALALLATVAFLPRLIGKFQKGNSMNVAALKSRLDQDEKILVLDVRTAGDFVGPEGHISGAMNLPLEELEERLEELAEYYEVPIILVCRTDRKSKKAAGILTRAGFSRIHVVAGGMTDWTHKNYPIELLQELPDR